MTQRRVSTSTGEAEYVSASESGKQARWMYSWYIEVDQSFNLPIIIYCDNDAAVTATRNTSGHSKLKHVDCYNFLTSSLLPFLFLFCQSTFLISTGGTLLLYLSFPSEQSDTHALLLSSYIAFIYCTASCILA